MKKHILASVLSTSYIFAATFSYDFKTGWNQFTIPFHIQDATVKSFIDDINSSVISIWGIEQDGKWAVYPAKSNLPVLTTLYANRPYYINCSSSITKDINGSLPNRILKLQTGWNLSTTYDMNYSVEQFVNIINSVDNFDLQILNLKNSNGIWQSYNPKFSLNSLKATDILPINSFFYTYLKTTDNSSVQTTINLPMVADGQITNYITYDTNISNIKFKVPVSLTVYTTDPTQ
jgi:hypothetical protein